MITVAKNWNKKITSLCSGVDEVLLRNKPHEFIDGLYMFVLNSLNIENDENLVYLIRCGFKLPKTRRLHRNRLTYDKRNGNCILSVGNDVYTWTNKINW